MIFPKDICLGLEDLGLKAYSCTLRFCNVHIRTNNYPKTAYPYKVNLDAANASIVDGKLMWVQDGQDGGRHRQS